jgi:Flp pilus assembly protein TadD
MISTYIRRLYIVVSFCIVGFIYVLCIDGCTESTNSAKNTDWVTDKSDLDFETQANKPPTAKTLSAMAEILAAQGRDSDCEYVLKRIIQDDPKFLPAYNSLAELQMRQGQTNTAIETLRHALNINPNDPVILNNLGMCWIVRQDYQNALKMFTKAAGIMPENVKYRANMAVALGLMGRDEESLALFKQILPEDQANHNLTILREARNGEKPASTTISQFQHLQDDAK